ncbi:hypothetical protein Q31a_39660 [Aureliella helgolandensis]|uniref:Uncharacterized protein n=1 Tax=Aureliella helgolandensis TaxID=2527968 RepID=A0A518GAT2_9BACT|nr:hypothetical protein Q31a_39660 [Aureliella helgolandensis]
MRQHYRLVLKIRGWCHELVPLVLKSLAVRADTVRADDERKNFSGRRRLGPRTYDLAQWCTSSPEYAKVIRLRRNMRL